MTNTLHRNTDNKMLAGVCSMIAEKSGLDLNITRLAVAGGSVVGAAFFGLGLAVPVLYVLAWVLLPGAHEETSIAQRWFSKPSVQNAMQKTEDAVNKKL